MLWQLFRWKAGVPAGAKIDVRAATGLTQSENEAEAGAQRDPVDRI